MADPLIVGLDPSSAKLAFYGLHPNLPTVMPLAYNLGKPYKPESAGNALDASLEAVEKLCSMSRAAPKFAFVESPVVGRGGVKSTLVQAFVSGVAQACLVKAGFTVYMINQTTWKNWIAPGPAKDSKARAHRAMKGRFPKDYSACGGDGDLLDAAALARYGHEAVRRGALVASIRNM